MTEEAKTDAAHGLVHGEGRVTGTIAVRIPPGTSHEARARLIDDELAEPLANAAAALNVVLAAAPSRYARERPGRDAEGRTVLDVAGRVEGDLLMPAVSAASKKLRR
jgi:hypothetical protein